MNGKTLDLRAEGFNFWQTAGATFHTVWGHWSCTPREKNANYQLSLSNKDEEVGWEGRFDGEFMRTRIKASFMKHPICSLHSRPASLDLSLSPQTAPWERLQGNCQRGNFNNSVQVPMGCWNKYNGFQFDGKWNFNIWEVSPIHDENIPYLQSSAYCCKCNFRLNWVL